MDDQIKVPDAKKHLKKLVSNLYVHKDWQLILAAATNNCANIVVKRKSENSTYS